jgi:hypothetical protein
LKRIIIIGLTIVFAAISAKLQAQSTETTSADAQIVAPISISETASLNFGTMSSSGTVGTLTLSTTGVKLATGGVNTSSQSPLASNAVYTVGGAINTTYIITLPPSITVSNGTPADDMIINALLARTASAGADGLTGTLGATGFDTFSIGGTLNVAASQTTGAYTGVFSVTVAYN